MSAKDERSTVHSPAGPARFAVARDRRTLDVGRCVTRLLYKPARAACRERTVHGSQATPIVVPHVLFFMFFMLVDIFLRFMWVDESPHKNEIYMRARARDPEERNDKTGCTAFIRTLTPVTLSEISLFVLARNVHRVGHRRAPCTGCTSSDGYYGSALLYTGGGAVSADVGPRNPSVVVDAAEAARPQAARPAWRRHHLIAD